MHCLVARQVRQTSFRRRVLSTAKSQKARLGKVTAKAIKEVATNIDKRIVRMRKPEVTFPVRSLGNLRYDPRKGYFEIGNIMGTTFTLVAM
jgi:DNA topoisomerase VI subunit A